MTDLADGIFRVVGEKYEAIEENIRLKQEITRLQSALTEAQVQGEVMRETGEQLLSMVQEIASQTGYTLDGDYTKPEDGFVARFQRKLSTPPTAVARVIEAERKPGEGWQISEETRRSIEEIERNQREAAANARNILLD